MVNPMFQMWKNSVQVSMMAAEAQAVIAMRVWGMAGLWSVTPHEKTRMIHEKAETMMTSGTRAGFAAATGKRPDQVMAAAIKPMRQKTRANSKRLAKRGPKLT